MIGLSLKGMDKLQKAIDSKNKALITGVDNEMKATVMEINKVQVSRCPKGPTGKAHQSLFVRKDAVLTYRLVSEGMGSEYTPYLEFGTGGLVDIPKGLESEAAKFKGRGIRKVNMKARPFFFSPFFEEKNNLLKRIQKILDI
jgi:hypothetical protein